MSFQTQDHKMRPAEHLTMQWTRTLVIAAIFFFCSADLYFSARIHDYNVRFGQFFLFLSAVTIWTPLVRKPGRILEFQPLFKAMTYWILFFGSYGLSVVFSPDPAHSALKWGWALFNIGGAATLMLHRDSWVSLKNGILLAITTIAALIWIEFIALYWFRDSTSVIPIPSEGLRLFWNGLFIGHVQEAARSGGTFAVYRPHAFYYEPSYGGCALAFAYPLCLAVTAGPRGRFWRPIFIPAFILLAIWLTSSRGGILASCFSTVLLAVGGALMGNWGLTKRVGAVFLTAVLMGGTLFLSHDSHSYSTFFVKATAPQRMIIRVNNTHSSEGWRLANFVDGVLQFDRHPILGVGVPPPSQSRGLRGLGQTAESMWLEVAIEGGFLGFLAFTFGFFGPLSGAFRMDQWNEKILFVAAAIGSHAMISMNLTSTFPRLDYWLIYFFAVRLLLEERSPASLQSGVSRH